MIFVGNDLVEVDRIRVLIERWSDRFLRRVFTGDEIAYCERQVRPAMHFAGRFAAKEAVKKALYSTGRSIPILFRQIQIARDPSGVPVVQLTGLSEDVCVSISHTDRYAMATAVMQSNDPQGQSV